MLSRLKSITPDNSSFYKVFSSFVLTSGFIIIALIPKSSHAKDSENISKSCNKYIDFLVIKEKRRTQYSKTCVKAAKIAMEGFSETYESGTPVHSYNGIYSNNKVSFILIAKAIVMFREKIRLGDLYFLSSVGPSVIGSQIRRRDFNRNYIYSYKFMVEESKYLDQKIGKYELELKIKYALELLKSISLKNFEKSISSIDCFIKFDDGEIDPQILVDSKVFQRCTIALEGD